MEVLKNNLGKFQIEFSDTQNRRLINKMIFN